MFEDIPGRTALTLHHIIVQTRTARHRITGPHEATSIPTQDKPAQKTRMGVSRALTGATTATSRSRAVAFTIATDRGSFGLTEFQGGFTNAPARPGGDSAFAERIAFACQGTDVGSPNQARNHSRIDCQLSRQLPLSVQLSSKRQSVWR
jgi:hypothetical protein